MVVSIVLGILLFIAFIFALIELLNGTSKLLAAAVAITIVVLAVVAHILPL